MRNTGPSATGISISSRHRLEPDDVGSWLNFCIESEPMTLEFRELVVGYTCDLNAPLTAKWTYDVIAVTAANGRGKSTLLRTILGLVPPRSGSIHVQGNDSRTQAQKIRQCCGWMPDTLGLPDESSVHEVIALACWAHRVPLARGLAQAEALGVSAWLRQPLGACSLGQKRRTALVAALVSDPAILLLDEPTVGLDAAANQQLAAMVTERTASGKLTVAATHENEWIRAVAAEKVQLVVPTEQPPVRIS
jgi:ABC-2 type transport system ATP-binding protein